MLFTYSYDENNNAIEGLSDILHLETTDPNLIPEAKIYSIQGVLVIHTQDTCIDVSALPNGIYIVEANGFFMKIVKQ